MRRWTPRSSRSAGPARCTCGSRAVAGCTGRSTSRPARTPASVCSAPRCSTRDAPRCARWPGSRRCTGSSRCSNSIGVKTRWLNADNDLEIVPPAVLDLAALDLDAARRTRSIIMFLAPLMHHEKQFELPYAGGCALGTRTVEPHMTALRPFGVRGRSHRRQLPGRGRSDRPAGPSDRADRARRHRDRERADGRRPQRRRHRDPQRELRTTWCRTCASSWLELGVAGRGHRHHHAHRARRAADPPRRRLLPVRGPDRGDEPGNRRRS